MSSQQSNCSPFDALQRISTKWFRAFVIIAGMFICYWIYSELGIVIGAIDDKGTTFLSRLQGLAFLCLSIAAVLIAGATIHLFIVTVLSWAKSRLTWWGK